MYVFTRSGTAWSQQAYLKASNADGGDLFGSSVALEGDTLIVGAPGESSAATGIGGNELDNTAGGAGAVYVFTRSAGIWSQREYLKASNTNASDLFGGAVALHDDTLAVGAVGEASGASGSSGNQLDNSALRAGAVYVFTSSGGVWSQQAYLKASNTDADDQFGFSVDLDGDSLAIGARGEASSATGVNANQLDDTAADAGAAYLFTRSAGTWSQQEYFKASNTGAGDEFGFAVAIEGETLVVGAPKEDSLDPNNPSGGDNDLLEDGGAAYVFTSSVGVWSQQAALLKGSSEFGAYGNDIALEGHLLAIGSEGDFNDGVGVNDLGTGTAMFSGAVFIVEQNAGVWSTEASLKASNTDADDLFGTSVALDGDTLAIGASFESSAATGIDGDQLDNTALFAGAAYVRRLAPVPTPSVPAMPNGLLLMVLVLLGLGLVSRRLRWS